MDDSVLGAVFLLRGLRTLLLSKLYLDLLLVFNGLDLIGDYASSASYKFISNSRLATCLFSSFFFNLFCFSMSRYFSKLFSS